MPGRWQTVIAVLGLGVALTALAQSPDRGELPPDQGPPSPPPSDVELVERLIAARKEYQTTLELLRAHYIKTGDKERARWAEEELLQYHRILKQSFRLDVGDVPPPTLEPKYNVRQANELFMQAMYYKDRGFGTDYLDNQRRAEILLQQILTQYPRCDKIGQVAYQLGDLYESKAYRQYRRAAAYFERSYQWDRTALPDARLRAARIYDRSLGERAKAIELYREVLNHDTDPARRQEAERRLADLAGSR